ncbi:hypothetical protein, partial [Escherichia coli]|uniref:hypothetical protein n=1 Tax=Escherichia coli TaxID=562 RepID=UPI0019343F66
MAIFDAAGAEALRGVTITAEILAFFDFETAVGGIAPVVTFTLEGVGPEAANDVVNAKTEVKGRDCAVYLQLYDPFLTPLGSPYTLYRGVMDRLIHTADANTWTVQLTAETKFSRRGLPPFG